RTIAYACAHATDMARYDPERSGFWLERVNLLTPLAKAFPTDVGVEVASLGVQVHGGMGYIEETGAALLLRDARIAPIYEGTNGIQAIDLVTRKLPMDDGVHLDAFISELRAMSGEVRSSGQAGIGGIADRLDAALGDLAAASGWLARALRE